MEAKEFYNKLKKELQVPFSYVVGIKSNLYDINRIGLTKDFEYYKIIAPHNVKSVEKLIELVKKQTRFFWFSTKYILIYVDYNYNELRRETIVIC